MTFMCNCDEVMCRQGGEVVVVVSLLVRDTFHLGGEVVVRDALRS